MNDRLCWARGETKMPQDDEEVRERARRKGRRGSISAECSINPSHSEPSHIDCTVDKGGEIHTAQSDSRPPNNDEQLLIRSRLSPHFLFSSISSVEAWQEILSSMGCMNVREGETIIEQNSLDAEYLYVVHSGSFGVWQNGERLQYEYSEPGLCFGELALMYQCPRQATVRCTKGPGVLWTLDRMTFKRVLMRNESKKYKGEAFLPALKKNWLLRANLSDFELEKVADVMTEEEYSPTGNSEGQMVVAQGDAQYSKMRFYIVLEGTVFVSKRGGVKVRSLTVGDYFGERSLLEKVPRTASVTTNGMEIVRLGTLEWSNFDRLLRKPCLKAFVQRIESGYERTRHAFYVDGVRFGTNLACLSGHRFESPTEYFAFMKSLASSDDDFQRGFWVMDERYPTKIPSLIGRSFPSVESYVEYLTIPVASVSPSFSPLEGSKREVLSLNLTATGGGADQQPSTEQKALATAKRRGRRGSVSGDPSTSVASSAIMIDDKALVAPSSVDLALLNALRNHFLFADLEEIELKKVALEMVQQRFNFGDYVIVQGDEQTDFFYLVRDGLFVVEKDGKRLSTVEYGPGSAFGELALMYYCPRAASVLCNSRTGTVFALNRDLFRAVLVGSRSARRDRLESFLKEQIPLFADWTKEALSRVADVAEEVEFQSGHVIIKQSESDFSTMRMYFVKEGAVDIAVDGRSVRTIEVGGYFGERAIVERIPRSATCTPSTSNVVCLALDVPAFERLLGPLRNLFRGKFTQYHVSVDFSQRITQHNLSVPVGAKPKEGKYSHPTGWFRVGKDIFRTNVVQLNCKVFKDMEDYSRFLSIASRTDDSEDGDESEEGPYGDQVYRFTVGTDSFPTRISTLIGKRFTTVEAYIEFLCNNNQDRRTFPNLSLDTKIANHHDTFVL